MLQIRLHDHLTLYHRILDPAIVDEIYQKLVCLSSLAVITPGDHLAIFLRLWWAKTKILPTWRICTI